jgi:thymidylate synthase
MKAYLNLLQDVLENGEVCDNERTGVGTLALFGRQIRFDLREGFPLMTTKRVPFRWIAEELFWFLSGNTNESVLRAKGVDIWKEWADYEHTRKFARDEQDMGPIYGYLWRSFGGKYPLRNGLDQFDQLFRTMNWEPFSRRLIITGWDPRACNQVTLPPCHTLYQFNIHPDGAVSCHLYARSIDIFLGLPFNIASYALLTHLVAHVTGRITRELIISFGNLHIYKNHIEQANIQLARDPLPLSTLNIKGYRVGLEGLLGINIGDLELQGYRHHPKIQADVAV